MRSGDNLTSRRRRSKYCRPSFFGGEHPGVRLQDMVHLTAHRYHRVEGVHGRLEDDGHVNRP